MIEINLKLRDGTPVGVTAKIPPFLPGYLPKCIVWGGRAFMSDGISHDYLEDMIYPVIEDTDEKGVQKVHQYDLANSEAIYAQGQIPIPEELRDGLNAIAENNTKAWEEHKRTGEPLDFHVTRHDSVSDAFTALAARGEGLKSVNNSISTEDAMDSCKGKSIISVVQGICDGDFGAIRITRKGSKSITAFHFQIDDSQKVVDADVVRV